jgi:hypothetical protein
MNKHRLQIGRDLNKYFGTCHKTLMEVYTRQFKTGNWVSRRFMCNEIAGDIWQSIWSRCNPRVRELLISSVHIYLLAETGGKD